MHARIVAAGGMRLRVKQLAGVALNVAIFAVLLLAPAGTVRWPRAWVFLGVVAVAGALSVLAIPEDLLDERYKPLVQEGQPFVDKVVVVALVLSFLGAMVLIPLDVFRLHWLGSPGALVSWAGLVLFAAGWWLMTWAMVANAFAAPVVRFQRERRHRVVDGGPYRVVRHPMYAAVLPIVAGAALWLGSYAAAIAAIVPVALAAVRALFEERFLRRELSGYAEYTRRTRFRLVPYVW